MKRTAKWMKKLTMKELKHLAECSANGRPTLASLKKNRAHQVSTSTPCFECRHIALKMGLEV